MENLLETSSEIEIIKFLSNILSNEKLRSPIDEIWELVYENRVTKLSINEILASHKIKNIEKIKRELIELISIIVKSFIKFHSIDLSQNEINFARKLMRVFSIDESDIYKFRKNEVAEILQPELEKINFNIIFNKNPIYQIKIQDPINAWVGSASTESIYKVKLQEIFGLGYDQFLEFANVADKKAIEEGAILIDLDTVLFIKKEKRTIKEDIYS